MNRTHKINFGGAIRAHAPDGCHPLVSRHREVAIFFEGGGSVAGITRFQARLRAACKAAESPAAAAPDDIAPVGRDVLPIPTDIKAVYVGDLFGLEGPAACYVAAQDRIAAGDAQCIVERRLGQAG